LLIDRVHLSSVVIRLYRQVSAEPSVDQGQQFNILRSSERLNGCQGRTNAPAGIKYVVNKDHPLVLYHKINAGFIGFQRLAVSSEIIAIEGDIQFSQLDLPH